jgi:sRNA-binding protein
MLKRLFCAVVFSCFLLGCVQGPLVDLSGVGVERKPRTPEEQAAHDKAKQEKEEKKRQEKLRKEQEKKDKEAQDKAKKEQQKKKAKDDDD